MPSNVEAMIAPDEISVKIQVSKKTFVGKPMSLQDVQDVTDKIKDTTDAVKSLADIVGSFEDALEKEANRDKLKKSVGTISSAGDILKGILKLIPSPEDPMVQALQDLVDSVDQMEQKISSGFNELKALITDVNFVAKIISPTLVLSNYMNDCIQYPGPDAKENFKKAYFRNTPIKLAYNLISCMEQESTNPLKTAVTAAEKEKAKVTFDAWTELICRVLGQLIIIEAFANGFLKPLNINDCDLLIDRSLEQFRKIRELEEEYKKAEREVYFEEIKAYMSKDVLPFLSHPLGAKIGWVQKTLDEIPKRFIFVNDAYTVGFFESARDRDNEYTYHCPNESSDLIGYWNEGNLNAFIYRSNDVGSKTDEDDANLQKTMEQVRDSGIVDNGSLDEMMKTQIVEKGLTTGYGFILLNRAYKNLEYCTITKNAQAPSKRMKMDIKHVNVEPYDLVIAY